MEEVHVLDEGESDGLTGGEEETGEGTEDVVGLEVLDEDGAENHESTEKLSPEENGKTSPEVERRDPLRSVKGKARAEGKMSDRDGSAFECR